MSVRVPTLFDDFFDDDEEKKPEDQVNDVEHSSNNDPAEEVKENNNSQEIIDETEAENPHTFDDKNTAAPQDILEEENLEKNSNLDELDKQIRAEIPYEFGMLDALQSPKKSAIVFEMAEPETMAEPEIEVSTNLSSATDQSNEQDKDSALNADVSEPKNEVQADEEIEPESTNEHDETSAEHNDTQAPEEQKIEAISPFEPTELTKQYYGISEVAKMFDVSVSNIRFWTTEFNFKPRTNKKGDRLYTPQLIEKIRLIYNLVKVHGHTIKGAKVQLGKNKKSVSAQVNLKDQLIALKSQLEHLRRQLYEQE